MLLDKEFVRKFSKDSLCNFKHKLSFENFLTNVIFVPLSLWTFVGQILVDILLCPYQLCVCVCVCVGGSALVCSEKM